MGPSRLLLVHLLLLLLPLLAPNPNPNSPFSFALPEPEDDPFSIMNLDLSWHDYSPPTPPPPPSSPTPPSSSCEGDIGGSGSFDTLCELKSSVNISGDIYIKGNGSLSLLPGVVLRCPVAGCFIIANLSGEVTIGTNGGIVAGGIIVAASNMTMAEGSVVDTTALAGDPPPQTSGEPSGFNGDGGGHGGRGASCYVREGQTQEDSWGGDAYSWSSLTKPDSFGSKGGSTSREKDYGGGGGGRIWMEIKDVLEVDGVICADGGEGGSHGGGGSGGSIYMEASKLTGSGKVSASGGNGVAGGGGGRVSINIFSRHDDPKFFVHGGRSSGCPNNSGAAGTLYDAVPRSLTVNNQNLTTQTDTLLLEFPNQPLWTNVFVKNCAKVVVPLLWSRVQVQGQLSLLCDGILSFGLTRYPYSEFELLAEELLMSDSVIRVFGALQMSVKMLLMWNSKMLINGGGYSIVSTSFLEASNVIVLKGLLNLSGPGDLIEAQRLILSLFYSINVGPGSVLRGPLINASSDEMASKLQSSTVNFKIAHWS